MPWARLSVATNLPGITLNEVDKYRGGVYQMNKVDKYRGGVYQMNKVDKYRGGVYQMNKVDEYMGREFISIRFIKYISPSTG